MLTRVKICCISSVEEARQAARLGADALGLVSAMPSGPGVIDDQTILGIASIAPPTVATFLLTSKVGYSEIMAQARECRVNTLQLVSHIECDTLARLRDGLPGVKLVQVIHVLNETSVTEASQAAPFVDAILLDSGNPQAPIKELGGTGRVHNWSLSRKIRDSIDKPLFLAGGLDASNVREAIEVVRPFGVDVCSGVRTDGRLDTTKLSAFMNAVRSTSAGPAPG